MFCGVVVGKGGVDVVIEMLGMEGFKRGVVGGSSMGWGSWVGVGCLCIDRLVFILTDVVVLY